MAEPQRLDFPESKIMKCACLFQGNGQAWIFVHVLKGDKSRLEFRRLEGRKWSEVGVVAELGDRTALEVELAPGLADSTEPMLLWSVSSNSAQDKKIKMSRWLGEIWSPPEDTPGVMSQGGRCGLVALNSRRSQLLAMFTGNLEPPEEYSVGGHGWSPVKPFYMNFSGTTWSKASAMAPRSRWTFLDLAVVGGPGVREVVARTQYGGPIWIHPSRLECGTVTEDGNWIDRSRIGDGEGSIYHPTGARDSEGVLHVAYDLYIQDKGIFTRYRTKKGNEWSDPRNLGGVGINGCVGGDSKGNIYLYWTKRGGAETHYMDCGYIKVISGQRESLPMDVAPIHDARFYQTPGPRVYLVGTPNPKTVSIQQIMVPDDSNGLR
ncbi:MAG: hypothetical protein ACE15C_13155 [Phycisphaerae bacterium]